MKPATEEQKERLLKTLNLTEEGIEEQLKIISESLTPEHTAHIIHDIADTYPDINTVEPQYRIAFLVRQAYLQGALTIMEAYKQGIEECTDILEEGE